MVYPDQPFAVTLVLTNTGAAPAYHRFPVEVALCTTGGVPLWRGTFLFDLRELTPGLNFSKTESFTVTNLALGVYSLRVGIIDPRTGQPGVRFQSAGEDAQRRIILGTITVADAWTTDSDADGMTDGWELQHFGSATNATASADDDADGFSNLEHFISSTEPTNPTSFFRVDLVRDEEATTVRFDTVTNRRYRVLRTSELLNPVWFDVATNLAGTGTLITVPDPLAVSNGFYRADVRLP